MLSRWQDRQNGELVLWVSSGGTCYNCPYDWSAFWFKQETARMVSDLKQFTDQMVRADGLRYKQGGSGKPRKRLAGQSAGWKTARIQGLWAGLGRKENPLFWLNAPKEQWRVMVLAETMEAANERKCSQECRQAGWKAIRCPVEVACKGFVPASW